MRRYIVSLILCVACLLLPVAYAQVTTGIITGTVTDQTGAVAANVPVTVTNTATGATRTMNTNSAGDYRFEALPTGIYQVTVKAPNFKESVTSGVEVHAATATTADVKLQVGSATEHVDVEANAIQVQTDNAALGETVEGQQVRELPLNGRSFVQLTQLQPGVSAANNFDSKNKGLQGGVDFSVNGNATTNNLYLVDGANNNDTGSNRTILIYPSIESIAEFKMLRNSYGAEYGQAAGAVINIVTRSGSNDWHGSVLYSGRNTALNARTYFAAQRTAIANAAGQTLAHDGKDKVNRNDWGYSLGGPIIKNKLFFFWSQEWNHEIRGITRTACVPNANERAGNFAGDNASNACGFAGSSPAEHLPNIPAALQTAGNPYGIANPSPAGLLMLQKYPLPNQAMTGGNNWSASLPTPLKWRQENMRVDYNMTKNNTFMGRFTQDTWSNAAYNAGYWGEDPFPALNDNWYQPSKSIVGKWTRTIGTTMVNDAEFSYSNNRINITPGGINPGNGGLYGTALLNAISAAIPSEYPQSIKRDPAGIPTLWGGLNAYGSYNNYWSIAPWNNTLDLYVAKDDASKVIGKHTIKFGGQMSWNGKNEDTSTSSSERATFGSANWATSVPTNNDVANILIPGALWNISETSTNVRAQLRWHDNALYVADNWKLTPRLTLDLGLRWDQLNAPYQPNDQITNFQPNLYNPAAPASDACNGLWVVAGQNPCGAANAQFGTNFSSGTPGPGRALVNNNNHLFSPRVGIAWDPWGDGNTAIRVGAGRFMQRERVSRYTLVANAPFAVTSTVNRPLDTTVPLPVGGAAPAGGMDPRAIIPESWQWNVSIQRSLARDTTLEVGYVGNHAYHQTSSYDINQIAPQNWLAASFNQAAANQTAGYFAFNNYNSALTWWTHQGDATYHSLQTLFKTRYRRSQLTAAYTWSHSISNVLLDDSSGGIGQQSFMYPGDPRLDRGNSSINRPHIFTANFNYYLPDLNQASKMVRGAFGGWELGLITTEAMGNSTTVYQNGISENTSNTVGGAGGQLNSLFNTGYVQAERPMVVPGQSCAQRQGDVLYNQSAFTLIGYQIGTISPNMEPRGYCHGPSLLDTDISIDKNFKLTERVRMQFRIDLFNMFNHANFRGDGINNTAIASVNCGPANAAGLYQPCSPTNNIVSAQSLTSNFGQATTVVGNAGREIQYGVHITF
ncbi:MAG TPA: carboxypeptidase regulatory-like domain-containing protein [Terriglobales bacterium]|nr:carboxypeptidase regulatory-like domain-containing protein [Terriglobales bacterium]